jgi:hypothetical protein
MPAEVQVALISLVGVLLPLLNGWILILVRDMHGRIKGLKNGTKAQALAEIERLYQQRQLRGLPTRRDTDRIIEHE